MARDVLCEVMNCKYWEDGNRCSAEAIYIVSSNQGKTAEDSSTTDCKTFKPEH